MISNCLFKAMLEKKVIIYVMIRFYKLLMNYLNMKYNATIATILDYDNGNENTLIINLSNLMDFKKNLS